MAETMYMRYGRVIEACDVDAPDGLTGREVETIRGNYERLGYAHWFSDYGREYWRHPETGRHVSFYEW